MGGCHGADALFVKMGQDSNGKSGTLGWVGTCTKLIEEDQGVLICGFQEGNHVCHMRGEGT